MMDILDQRIMDARLRLGVPAPTSAIAPKAPPPDVSAASASANAKKLERLRADLLSKYPNGTTVRTIEIGPQTRAMMQLADAVQQQRRGDVDQTSAATDTHKLPPHITYG